MGLDTWNPWHGCHKCSEGCRHCYMYYLDAYRERPEWSGTVFRTGKFSLPLKKNRQKQYKIKAGQRIRVNMTSDTFIEEAEEWMPEFWSVIRRRPDVIFWLLTKRPQNILRMLPDDWDGGYENVCLNITAEDQENFDKRWKAFRKVPAKHKGLCLAPLLGPIDITSALYGRQVEEVAAGGENYDGPRICDYGWIESLSRQCAAFRVNFCWYESGTNFRKDGKTMHWPRKSDQGAIAYLSGLNQKFYTPKYILKDPADGHLLEPEELYHNLYNLRHCTFCSNRMLCNGCLSCGDCKEPPVLRELNALLQEEQWLLKNQPPLVYETYFKRKEGQRP